MRKILVWCLILCLSFALGNQVTASESASPIRFEAQDEFLAFLEKHKDDPLMPETFILPDEISFLGPIVECGIDTGLVVVNGKYRFADYWYRISIDWGKIESGYTDSARFSVFDASAAEPLTDGLISISSVDGNMAKLKDDVVADSEQLHRIQRGELTYTYYGKWLRNISWEQGDYVFKINYYMYQRLYNEVADKIHDADNFIAPLLSLNNYTFSQIQAQLMRIGNPNPPENICGLTYPHSYSNRWSHDKDTHWCVCQCGNKGNTGFHTDEDENGQCDTCQYQMRREEVQEPTAPPAQPTTPTGPVAQPTEPTHPPTASPPTPATQPPPAPAGPNTPNAGLWIGVGSGIVCVAAVAVVLLLRKKKHT